MKKHPHLAFIIVCILLIISLYIAITSGSITVTFQQLIQKMTTGSEPQVEAVIDLRLPRIIIAIFVGASLSVSGALLQAVLQNPLAEANIIGVTSGALVARGVVLLFFPTAFFYLPILMFIGGLIPFFILFILLSKYRMTPMRIIFVGVALYAIFNGLLELLSVSPITQLPTGLTMKTWKDVYVIITTNTIGLIIACLLCNKVNLLTFNDKQASNLGFNMTKYRLIIGFIAVFIVSSTTAIVGPLTFVGLIVPHIARRIVGSNYVKMIPFSIVFGALIVLAADTLGRMILPPNEISANIFTTVIGGICLMYLICKGAYRDASREY